MVECDMLPWLLSLALLAPPTLQTAPQETDLTLSRLSKIRVDRNQIHSIRDITISRDVLSITFNRGAIAFTEAIDGKVTGAVFLGSGDILAIPPDATEKKQLFRYTKSALLSEHFETAVLRFTDGTLEEILKELKNHATETVEASDAEALLRWEPEVQRRAGFLNSRILADMLSTKPRPFFLAQIEGARLGWFDAVYDERSIEEVLLEQSTTASMNPLVWASFNKRSEVRDPVAAAHEDKAMFDSFSLSADGTEARLKAKADGERVLQLPVASVGVTGVSLQDSAIPFFSERDRLVVVLPVPTQLGSDIVLRIEPASRTTVSSPSRSGMVVAASYRDQWIIEGLANYASVLADPSVLAKAREQLLAVSPEGGSYESLGPVWIGFRLIQPRTTAGYESALKNKSIWILHMLRSMIQREERDPAFGTFLDEVVLQAQSSTLSTFDLKRIAEKHAGRPLDWFFDSWVFGTGIPTYSVSFKVDANPNGFIVSGNVSQTGVPDTFQSLVPLYADETFLGNVMVSSDGGEFRFSTRTRPQQVLVDPKKTQLTQN
jgi:hypothetical protein